MDKTILSVQDLNVNFGGVQALKNFSFDLVSGELLGLIGPNGAGKTTALKSIVGSVKPNSGKIFLGGKEITNLPVYQRIRSGLGFTHQLVRPFKSMSLRENVAISLGKDKTRIPLKSLFFKRNSQELLEAEKYLEIVGIESEIDSFPGKLPLGYLKRLEVARALALSPKVLLLDEPLAGLSQSEAKAMADVIKELNENGLSIVLIEHNLSEVLRICSRIVVLDSGEKIAEGVPAEVIKNKRVISAYIGDDDVEG